MRPSDIPDLDPEKAIPNALLNTLLRRSAQFQQRALSVDSYENIAEGRIRLQQWKTMTQADKLQAAFAETEQTLADDGNRGCNHLAAAFGPEARKRLIMSHSALTKAYDELGNKTPSAQMVKQAMIFAQKEVGDLVNDLHRRLREAGAIAQKDADVADANDAVILSAGVVDTVHRLHGLQDGLRRCAGALGGLFEAKEAAR
jgi:hypothetical protein